MNEIETPTIAEILREEFLEPMELSVYALAKGLNVPVSRIQDILNGKRKITADTSLRLARFFGVSDEYFLRLQNDIDIRNARLKNADKILKIVPFARRQAQEKRNFA